MTRRKYADIVPLYSDGKLLGYRVMILNDKYLGWQILNEYRLIEYKDNKMINVRLINLVIDLIGEGYIFMTEK